MPSSHSFNASNEPNTCLWCGKKLYYTYHEITVLVEEPEETKEIADRTGHLELVVTKGRRRSMVKTGEKVKAWEKPGYLGNGFFCTLGCGESFGLAMARNGRRLEPKKD